eukprot:maker-scaffold1854_size26324-snap-gene-0.3 protein:Tk00515 transcript:maker-scaffold1854_size26324-snap-gene-0.3-mRNA-1 annotation:"Exported protein of unknown function"
MRVINATKPCLILVAPAPIENITSRGQTTVFNISLETRARWQASTFPPLQRRSPLQPPISPINATQCAFDKSWGNVLFASIRSFLEHLLQMIRDLSASQSVTTLSLPREFKKQDALKITSRSLEPRKIKPLASYLRLEPSTVSSARKFVDDFSI